MKVGINTQCGRVVVTKKTKHLLRRQMHFVDAVFTGPTSNSVPFIMPTFMIVRCDRPEMATQRFG